MKLAIVVKQFVHLCIHKIEPIFVLYSKIDCSIGAFHCMFVFMLYGYKYHFYRHLWTCAVAVCPAAVV